MRLTESIQAGLKDIQFEEPTPVQEKAIPAVLDGKDIIATAQTGTGKTGAFVIPIMDQILRGERDGMKALIITPTRELAQQIDEQIFAIGYHGGISSATVIGGSDFSVQAKALKAGVDIIVATPGRLIDQKKIVNIDFSKLDYLVLDEADRMLDMGFLPDIKKIINWLPDARQTLLFSATMPKEIEQLASGIMKKDVVNVEIARAEAPKQVEQRAYAVRSQQKIPLLKKIFETIAWDSCIIFTSTKKGTDELQRLLKNEGIKAASIHGDRSQDERNKALNAFKTGKYPVIVATSVLARGIDIKDVSMIVNYDVPRTSDDYIHRIGRTGRYDKSGIAVTFVTRRDNKLFRDIDNIAGNKIKKISLPESFDEKSEFYWNKEDRKTDGKQEGKEQKREPSKKQEKPEDSAPPKKKKRPKRPPRPSKKSKSGKKASKNNQDGKAATGKQKQTGKEKEKSADQNHKKQTTGKAKKEKPAEAKRGKNEGKKQTPKKSGKPSPRKETVVNLPKVEKAAERKKKTYKPAKGVWGIVKSFLPRLKKD